mmetsp:Transcript_74071/g.176395  ORF Transcript_74071/g.176395 Transcript_74071/m.176395 type:complete len:290 (+) Transcript_74071:765-1634(+)
MHSRAFNTSISLDCECISSGLLCQTQGVQTILQILMVVAELSVIVLSSSEQLVFMTFLGLQRFDAPLFVSSSHLIPSSLATIQHLLRPLISCSEDRHDFIRALLQGLLSPLPHLLRLFLLFLRKTPHLLHLVFACLHQVSNPLLTFLLLLHGIVLHQLLLELMDGKVLRLFLPHSPQALNVGLLIFDNGLEHCLAVKGRARLFQCGCLRPLRCQVEDLPYDPSPSTLEEIVTGISKLALLVSVSRPRLNVCSTGSEHLHRSLDSGRAQVEGLLLRHWGARACDGCGHCQ